METDRDDEVAIENIVPVLQEEVIVEKKSQDNEFDEQMLRIINNSKILEAGEKEKMQKIYTGTQKGKMSALFEKDPDLEQNLKNPKCLECFEQLEDN